MDPIEMTIKQEMPECLPEIDLNALETVDFDLKPPILQPPEIGSRNSAFQPYKQLTILTNLQRGNVKTMCRDAVPSQPLTFQEKAAKGSLLESDITDSNVNSVDSDGFSALIWSTYHGQLSIIELLITKGADVNCPAPEGQTALMFAAAKGHVDVLNYLLASGADLETEDDYGNTALIHAAHYNQTQTLNALLFHGASMTKHNYLGDNAYDVAFRKGSRASQYAMEVHLKKILESNATD